MTTKAHWIAQALASLLQVLNLAGGFVPVKYQAWIAFGITVVQAGMGLYNHYYNPDGTPATVAYVAKLLILFLLLGSATMAQTPVPQVDSFSIVADAVSLPGSSGSSLAGTLAGFSLKVTPNFKLEQTNFISSSAETNAFMVGGDYNLNFLSKKLNNASPNLAGYDFSFSIHGDVGAARITQPSGAMVSGVAALFGGQVDYAIHGSKMFSLGVRVDDFFASRGLPKKNNLVIALGPKIHFGN